MAPISRSTVDALLNRIEALERDTVTRAEYDALIKRCDQLEADLAAARVQALAQQPINTDLDAVGEDDDESLPEDGITPPHPGSFTLMTPGPSKQTRQQLAAMTGLDYADKSQKIAIRGKIYHFALGKQVDFSNGFKAYDYGTVMYPLLESIRDYVNKDIMVGQGRKWTLEMTEKTVRVICQDRLRNKNAAIRRKRLRTAPRGGPAPVPVVAAE
ncbi:hypothetical protein FPQ18DRAFT_325471 [Pyronema domesticum]|uniref:Uncharacterized protein n=1 Tax=Pyronema omphalodes (strain CBS 100304) TaxID=1076935 RepID=U4LQW0_PYROM|nr:hypothetical protein FPQ18DRAFT_325471 [Pyronema domesticum]CCX29691.1 Protein of unknown function [Pyronema omphalodes CBS 100304]